jgi:tripartite ATP-independent transporter DctM subunit
MVYVVCVRRNIPATPAVAWLDQIRHRFWRSLPIVFMPIVIVGGIVGGVFTPTEAAGVAVVYVAVIGFITRKLKISHFPEALVNSAVVTAVVFFILGTSSIVAFEMTILGVPEKAAEFMLSLTSSTWVFLMLVNIFMLLIGMILEPIPAMVMLVPIFQPISVQYGVDQLHFGFIVVLNLIIGLLTPPVGPTLYICGAIARLTLEEVSRDILPWVIYLVVMLLLTTYVPALVLWLPRSFGF